MLHHGGSSRAIAAAFAFGTLACALGCSSDLLGLAAEAYGVDIPEGVQPTEGFIKVRFRNLAQAEAVDVQFHVSDNSLTNIPGDLFVPENLVVASVGVAGTGIIQPQKQDVIELPCLDDLTIGTQGGRFTDNETGEVRGVGTARWVQEGPVALCGSIVTFDFSAGESDGEFNTRITISY